MWNAGFGPDEDEVTSFTNPSAGSWNIIYSPENGELANQKEIYMTVTLDINDITKVNGVDCYRQTLYINGDEKVIEGYYNKKQWDYFITTYLNKLKYFNIGRAGVNQNGCWHYSKLNAYALRLYSTGLSKDEVIANYNASVAYHNILVNGENSGTSGETGGENIENVN